MKNALLACGLLFAAVLAAAPADAHEWKPVRKADPGCKWQAHAYPGKGLKLWFENCKAPQAHYELSWKGNVLEQHRPSDDRTFNGPDIIEVYAKPDNLSVAQAIADRFIEPLSNVERVNCEVVRDNDPSPPDGIERYRIVPSDAYQKETIARWQKENPQGGEFDDTLCSDHGAFEGEAYFEYHPGESTGRYLFVTIGQDKPLFDEDSIFIF